MLSNQCESWNQMQLVLSGFHSGYAIGISIMAFKCNSIISFIWFIHAFAEKKTVSPKCSFSAHSEFSREFRQLQKWTYYFLRISCWNYAFELQNSKKSILFSEKTQVFFYKIFSMILLGFEFCLIQFICGTVWLENKTTKFYFKPNFTEKCIMYNNTCF